MADTANSDNLVFGLGNPMRRCPVTGRVFEVGSGALPDEQQTANFIRERDQQQQAAPETPAPAPAPALVAELPAPAVTPIPSEPATLH